MATNEIREEEVKLGETRQIELPKLDISKYVGRFAKVEAVKEFKGNFGYYIRFITEPVDTLEAKDKDGNNIVLRGSRNFGLQTDKEGVVGWGEETKLGVFLKKKGVDHYRDLVGKDVQLVSVTNDEGVDYLSIN